ncbi:hypothetical protein SY85_24630 [Flavisolibacter tropicus]|uniref:Uncharacterized protein n=1 Tax=Flavisolibacter tropicus TaxID=1492898 RepID=A0A172U2G7_9BACT|nr:hypothetical protein SY85_24630 [Flavisolibacter tropicus]
MFNAQRSMIKVQGRIKKGFGICDLEQQRPDIPYLNRCHQVQKLLMDMEYQSLERPAIFPAPLIAVY